MSKNIYDYLTLGDGDFSFSLDMCRFLQIDAAVKDALNSNHDTRSEIESNRKIIKIVCSGIDTEIDLKQKYRDVDFIKKQILSLNKGVPRITKESDHKTKRPKLENVTSELQISIHHNVNAIRPWSSEQDYSCNPQLSNIKFKHVIFNHPHVGREDAQLHSRFLSHFFYSATNHWLATDGIVHLTLVKEQCERWNTIEHATKHGLVLLGREQFNPPPPVFKFIDAQKSQHGDKLTFKNERYLSKEGWKCRYQYRRHQSGRGFASRTSGSETLSFGRSEVSYNDFSLPWQHIKFLETLLQCPYCSKEFIDERARKNHIKCVHMSRSKPTSQDQFVCNDCEKTFHSEDALKSHKIAKHFSAVKSIKPDWAACELIGAELAPTESSPVTCTCNICGYQFSNEFKQKHYTEFIPVSSNSDLRSEIESKFSCDKCKKVFNDNRAYTQHSIFCKMKT
jgi:uncharacterized C2H2 Zn-finger protein